MNDETVHQLCKQAVSQVKISSFWLWAHFLGYKQELHVDVKVFCIFH